MFPRFPRVSSEVYFNVPRGEIRPLILTRLNSYGTEGALDLSHPDRWNFRQSPITSSLAHLPDIAVLSCDSGFPVNTSKHKTTAPFSHHFLSNPNCCSRLDDFHFAAAVSAHM